MKPALALFLSLHLLGAAALHLLGAAAFAQTLDQPTSDEATKAYRSNPYVEGASFGPPLDQARVLTCAAAQNRPGVLCQVAVKYAPLLEEQKVSLYFMRGANGQWSAAFE